MIIPDELFDECMKYEGGYFYRCTCNILDLTGVA